MSLADFFRVIGVPCLDTGASEAQIRTAESRLGGRLPDALRSWFREVDGFAGESKIGWWRFKSLARLHTVEDVFPVAREMTVWQNGHSLRRIAGSSYVIFCDALICAPFYAVNICYESPHFGEVILGLEELAAEGQFVSSTFERFAEFLFQHPEDPLLFPHDT